MSNFVWIILLIVVINIVGSLLQAAAKRKEEQRKLAGLGQAGQRRPGDRQPAAAPLVRQTSTPVVAASSAGLWAGRADGGTTPTSPSPQQLELERRRQTQLDELRRRRVLAMGGVSPTGVSGGSGGGSGGRSGGRSGGAAMPPPPPPSSIRDAAATVRQLDTLRSVRPQQTPIAQPPSTPRGERGRDEPRQARQARLAPVHLDADFSHVTPRDALGRVAARSRLDTQVAMPEVRGAAGLAKLREAVVLREIIDRPVALRDLPQAT